MNKMETRANVIRSYCHMEVGRVQCIKVILFSLLIFELIQKYSLSDTELNRENSSVYIRL